MKNIELTEVIKQLKKNEISIFDIPDEYKNAIEIVTLERKLGVRVTGKRGYDIISKIFFIEEDLIHIDFSGAEEKENIFLSFDDFESYYDFLNGDIYDNACYAFCPLINNMISSRNIDINRLMEKKSFINDTIDNYSLELSKEEKESYKNGKKVYRQCLQWTKKFNSCHNYEEFKKVMKNYRKSTLDVGIEFFISQYIFEDIKNQQRFSIIMKYLISEYSADELFYMMCLIYNPDDVLALYDYPGTKSTMRKHKNKLEIFIKDLAEKKIHFYKRAYFNTKTHYYCEKIVGGYENSKYPIVKFCRYFDTFEKFIDYRKGDLTDCDLTAALECKEDFSKYVVNETTKLPLYSNTEITYTVKKYYHNKKFYVTQHWYNKFSCVIKKYKHSFDYFFDFVTFLKGNLSEADLLFCDGLMFLEEWNTIDFSNAKMKSCLCEKFGLKYNIQEIKNDLIKSFNNVEKNEDETALILQTSRDLIEESERKDLSAIDLLLDYKCQKVHYVSDIHLMHKIKNACCHSKEDVIYVLQKIVDTIASERCTLLLIAGDVASDFSIFQLFVKLLSQTLHRNTVVVFTLGNHELWSFPGFTIEQIVSKYRTFLNEHGMYLLHNDILYREDHSIFDESNVGTHLIKYNELYQMNETQIIERLRNARYVILGGLGFSGYNKEFNANNGIYRRTVNRDTEIKETKIFEDLYNRLKPILINKNTIILTHTPKKDWCQIANPDKNYVYVSGHTHRNFFHDDGEYRIYSDNQVGYHNDSLYIKMFLLENDYDCFSDYDDGIYEISREQYRNFYRGKNISMTFQREVNILYMLKKKGYYCFIHKAKNGNLLILNGGAVKRLGVKNIQYYYDNMEIIISTLKMPLDKYTIFQKQIAEVIKKIGGDGTIHGCIIDIDFYNHVYVNPIDSSVTGYCAFDMIDKIVYPSIPALLENKCPNIFSNYIKMIEEKNENLLTLQQQVNPSLLPQEYLETDIYKASREIKKMQRLNSNILAFWDEKLFKDTKKMLCK